MKNPVKVSVGVLLVALFGTIALLRMPMQLTPEVQTPTITIETRWPGASPQEVEREIVQEQEEQLKSVEGVVKMTSECSDSQGRITLEFGVGTVMAEALLKVNSRLQQVREYPVDADEPVLTTASSGDRPIAWFILKARGSTRAEVEALALQRPEFAALLAPALGAQNTGLRQKRLRDAVEREPSLKELLPPEIDVTVLLRFTRDLVEARFERVQGVSNSNVLGGREEELQVIVDPARLAARGITVQEVRAALRGRNQDTSGGDFWEGKRRYVVRTLGQFTSPEEVAGVLLARREDAPVYVRDVAEVRLGTKKPTGFVRNFGTEAIAINCLRESGANVLEVMAGLQQALRELNDGPLRERGVYLEQVYDETDYIRSSVGLVKDNILLGGALTVAILLLFLRSGRSTLVIALAIPTSIIGTFLILGLLGRSLNVVSLAGLAFAVGMLVDNAVVVLENIYRRHQGGEPAAVAAARGTREVWGAVLSSTLTTLAVFLPILFVEDEAGQLFRDIALAISASVGLSLLVSITVIPVATSRLLRGQRGDGRFAALAGPLLRPLDAFGRAFVGGVVGMNAALQRSVARQAATVVVLLAGSALLTYALVPKVEYLPSGNRNLVFAILLPPPGYNLEELARLGRLVEEDLRPYWDVVPDSPEAARLEFPVIGDYFYVARGRQVFMGFRTVDPLRSGDLIPAIQRAAFKIPGAFAVVKQTSLFEQGLSAGRTIDIEITGPDLRTLVALGGRILGMAPAVVPDGQYFPKPSLDLSNPEVHILPHWEKAADLGVSAADLGYAVDALVDGAYAGDFFLRGEKIDLSILGRGEYAARLQDLQNLPIATAAGDLVPLSTLAEIALGSGPEQINRRERQRAITIEVTPPAAMALEEALERIAEGVVAPLEREGALAGGTRIRLAGTADKLRATWESLRFNLILALLITFLLMAALFESWLYPWVVIVSVPFGAVGGVTGLWLLNRFVPQPLDVLTMLGFVILVGTVVNNAILIVHQSLNHMREDGWPHERAILESLRTRVRPIFMTTLTTLFGLIPLVLFPGAGSELYRGLGSVLLGGLLVSTLFTLLLVPTLFHLALRTRAAWARAFGRIG
ncbi:MAG: efflux RND transporter permease subunit [Planctomycetaceae bacterium]